MDLEQGLVKITMDDKSNTIRLPRRPLKGWAEHSCSEKRKKKKIVAYTHLISKIITHLRYSFLTLEDIKDECLTENLKKQ